MSESGRNLLCSSFLNSFKKLEHSKFLEILVIATYQGFGWKLERSGIQNITENHNSRIS